MLVLGAFGVLGFTFEASLFEVRLILTNQAGARNAPNVRSCALLELFRERFLRQDVRNGDSAARLQQAEDLIEN
jgi:hypothetical protein